MPPRRFTRAEADDLLPQIAPLLFQLQRIKQEHDTALERVAELSRLMRGDGHVYRSELKTVQQTVEATAAKISDMVERVQSMGVELKSIDMGLIDFRSERDGREVYLCWRLGEEHVSFWHELETGFAGRQALEEEA